MDSNLWKLARYTDFLAERRKLLADAANHFLDSLLKGKPTALDYSTELIQPATDVAGEEEHELQTLVAWVIVNGLPKPELDFEISDPITGEALTIVDAAWPKGLQEEYSPPIALCLEGDVFFVK